MGIYLEAVGAIIRAHKAKKSSTVGGLSLPEVGGIAMPDDVGGPGIAKKIDKVVALLLPFSRNKCLYRGYALACILRKRGVEVNLNIGLRNFGIGAGSVSGHAWVTKDGVPLYDTNDGNNSSKLYPVQLGVTQTGVVCWGGLKDRDVSGLARMKRPQ